METDAHTSLLVVESDVFEDNSRETVVSVDHVSMVFNMASQQLNNLKEYFIALARHELMFKAFKALDDVSFEVKKGDVFGILGTNGSGKSTMLKIIAGVLEPSQGNVEVKGRIAPLIELGAGFDHELTARENIYLNGALLGYSRKFIEQHFDEIVEFAEIGDFMDIPLKNYSSGMIARIAFAIATVIVPDVLIVDEVLSVGDFMFQQKCERRIQELINEYQVTVLIVSHSTAQIERLCNKAIWIEKSHTRMLGSASDVCQVYQALAAHQGSAESEKAVLDMLLAPMPDGADDFIEETVAADDKYGTDMKMLKECAFSNEDIVVVVSGDNLGAQAVGIGLAGALQCPMVKARGMGLTRSTELTLANYAPCDAIVISEGAEMTDEVVREISAVCGGNVSIVEGTDATDMSQQVMRFMEELPGETPDPLTVQADNILPLASLSPTIYQQGIPVLIVNKTETHGERLQVEGNASNAVSSGLSTVCLASTVGMYDCFTAGIMANNLNASLICMDHNNLDEVCEMAKTIASQSSALRKAVFVGGDSGFNKTDKDLVRKIVANPALVPK